MVELVRVSPLGVPPNAARSLDAVVGQHASLPILAGQDVDTRALEAIPGSQAFGFGAPLAPGEVAFALPVTAEQAVGGALTAGSHVDVIAVPNDVRQAGVTSTGDAPSTVALGQGLTILALRTDDGRDLAAGDPEDTTSTIPPKLASVVVAIPAARLTEFATAAMTSTFYLGLETVPPPVATVP